jgi:hypothetical protein
VFHRLFCWLILLCADHVGTASETVDYSHPDHSKTAPMLTGFQCRISTGFSATRAMDENKQASLAVDIEETGFLRLVGFA